MNTLTICIRAISPPISALFRIVEPHLLLIQRRRPRELVRRFPRIIAHLIENASIQFCLIVHTLWRHTLVIIGQNALKCHITIKPSEFSRPSIPWPQKELAPSQYSPISFQHIQIRTHYQKSSLISHGSIQGGMIHRIVIPHERRVDPLAVIHLPCPWQLCHWQLLPRFLAIAILLGEHGIKQIVHGPKQQRIEIEMHRQRVLHHSVDVQLEQFGVPATSIVVHKFTEFVGMFALSYCCGAVERTVHGNESLVLQFVVYSLTAFLFVSVLVKVGDLEQRH
mmetsp:Transcript_15583/g.32912  ORF Transcript_15583/g.32912 Transcript_15583/m.32912 type:complete len:280 (-) Transcript_15583:886-1725(-)